MRCWIVLLAGCGVGSGSGFVVGELDLPGCDLGDSFDLGADYFVGQSLEDPTEVEEQARDALTIRAQGSGANVEIVDSLTIQVLDRDEIEERRLESVGSKDLRAMLSLYLSCPEVFSTLVAAPQVTCPEGTDVSPLCEGDFDEVSPYREALEAAFPDGSSCLVFCELGSGFGDEVAVAFRMDLVDGRSAEPRGYVVGRFRFELERGHGGQAFP